MKDRLLVALVFVPLLFIIMFFLPPYAIAAVIAVICAICAYELSGAIGNHEHMRITIYTVISAALIPVGVYFNLGKLVFTAIILVLMCAVFIEAIILFNKEKRITFEHIMTTLFGGALIPFLMSGLVSLKNFREGNIFVMLPVISAFITDAGSYFVGFIFGRHKAFPRISPKKTVEGYIGGFVIGTAAMIFYGIVLVNLTQHEIRFWALMLYGVIGAALTELGDLMFSLIKREFDVKDYGRLLPGHGGMLDRFDSMVLTAPAIYLMVSFFPAIIIN